MSFVFANIEIKPDLQARRDKKMNKSPRTQSSDVNHEKQDVACLYLISQRSLLASWKTLSIRCSGCVGLMVGSV